MNEPQETASSPESTPNDVRADTHADIHADYVNESAQSALAAFQATPDYEHLATFLNALREGYLVVDVTGEPSKKKRHRIRTIRSTKGQLVLPLFTSMDELREVVPGDRRHMMRGAVTPARDALAFIGADRFVAAEFNKGPASLVLLRKYVTLALGADEITAASLEAAK